MGFDYCEVDDGKPKQRPPEIGQEIQVEIDGCWYLAEVLKIEGGIGYADVFEKDGEVFMFSWTGWNFDPRVKL